MIKYMKVYTYTIFFRKCFWIHITMIKWDLDYPKIFFPFRSDNQESTIVTKILRDIFINKPSDYKE